MISFCIITDGQEPEALIREIMTIRQLNIPEYEIIVAGNCNPCNMITKAVQMPEVAQQGRIGYLRNEACRASSGDILVVLDDDMTIMRDFYDGLVKYGTDFDVLSCKLLNPDGTRYWDWRTHKDDINTLIDYNSNHPDISLTGGLTIMKRYVFDKVQWDENRGFYQKEDVDYSDRLKLAGFRISFNPFSTIVHNDMRYTQQGNYMIQTFPCKTVAEFMKAQLKT